MNKLVQEIADLVKKSAPKKEANLAHDFVHRFYVNPAKESLTRLPQAELADGLTDLWKFFQNRSENEPKFRVYHWKPKGDQALAERVVIDIVNDNMSFLLDSLYGLLNRLGTKPRLTFHPIIATKRDKKGNVEGLCAPQECGSDYKLESVIHCEVIENISPKLIKQLEKQLPALLKDVRWANQDWRPMRAKALETVGEIASYRAQGFLDADTVDESVKFLEWIENDHYTFLGYCNYDLIENQPGKIASRVRHDQPLGVLRDNDLSKLQTLFDGIAVGKETKDYIFNSFPIIINKTSRFSNVHRNVQMDCIGVRRYDATGKVVGIRLFVGLFTSVAYDSSARDIPLLRAKIEKIINRAGFTYDWHDGKALIHILDSLPRDELFQASIPELANIGLEILRLQERQRLAFFVRRDQFNRFLSCLVYIPRDRFDSNLCDRIGEILEEEFDGKVGAYKAQFGELSFARAHYTIISDKGLKPKYDIESIEKRLIEESRSWSDELKIALNDKYQEVQSAYLYRRYRHAFDQGYQARYKGKEALEDMLEIEKICSGDDPLRVRIYSSQDTPSAQLKLKIYNKGAPLPLSDVLPILENLDLRVLSEVPFHVNPVDEGEEIWIHDFVLESRGACMIDLESACQKFEVTLIKVRNNDIENDGFNRLVLRANLDWWQCTIFRAYAKYVRLIGLPFSKAYISDTLTRNPAVVKLLAELFETRFHPQKGSAGEEICNQINAHLEQIENIDEDRILRAYLTIMMATVRTNAYQHCTDQSHKPYISFKISSRDIEELPKPRPLYEVFVYSSSMEAIHLRGGKVARGGIRWSDRQEDFRTEVLGLVKAQMVKNTVIVPVGSKGGFIVKTPLIGKSRDEVYQEGVRCYRMLVKGLLDITDNLVDGKVVPPKDVVRWDDDDPYLVVAADKGTATFSDFANEVSNDYGFWLGDAFASGGSVGYDHKKMGITARGAWESVKRHFRELGTDVQSEPFRVMGVGDMSGDVFGNGMLLSRQIKLVAAFNHMHIFIDPDPDTEKSYLERERLFALPRSSWEDYDKKCLSKGAGIYERNAKKLKVTPEIVKMLGLSSATIKPDDLIKEILKHEADLLWFGGIGTYVKSSAESDSEVGDRANDSVRIDAKDLRVKVVGEGANLGCTQLARIEFERRSDGHANTDAIDNSAGVSCSDREVNIKILFNEIMRANKLTMKERNKLLEKMTDEVSQLVLKDNYLQPQIITMINFMGTRNFDQQIQLIRSLEQEGILDRQLEYLPDDTTLEEYQATQTCLTRAEISVLLGYSKISIYDKILATKIPEDPFFVDHLRSYFPTPLQKKYDAEILAHPLRREIIATYAVNQMINRSSASYIIESIQATGASLEEVCRSFFVASTIFSLEDVWADIEKLDNKIPAETQLKALADINKILRRTTTWLLRHYPMSNTIEETANVLCIGIESFLTNVSDSLDERAQEKLARTIEKYEEIGLPQKLSRRLALLRTAAASPDIILIASETGHTVPEVAELYFKVGQTFHFSPLRDVLESAPTNSLWERRQVANLIEDFYNYQSDLVVQMLSYAQEFKVDIGDRFDGLMNSWIQSHKNQIDNLEHAITESQVEIKPNLTALNVIARDLRLLSGN